MRVGCGLRFKNRYGSEESVDGRGLIFLQVYVGESLLIDVLRVR